MVTLDERFKSFVTFDLSKSRSNGDQPSEDWGNVRLSNLEEACRENGLSVRQVTDQLLDNMSLYIVKK